MQVGTEGTEVQPEIVAPFECDFIQDENAADSIALNVYHCHISTDEKGLIINNNLPDVI